MTREENEKIINSRIYGRRSTDIQKNVYRSDGEKLIKYINLLKKNNCDEFNEWYNESGFNTGSIKLKSLIRLYNKRTRDESI